MLEHTKNSNIHLLCITKCTLNRKETETNIVLRLFMNTIINYVNLYTCFDYSPFKISTK